MNTTVDTSPEIIEFDSGEKGYFYNLTQLEEIRNRKVINLNDEEVHRRFNRHTYAAIESVMVKHNLLR